MIKSAFRVVMSLIDKARGVQLDELNTWSEILQTFDERRRREQESIEIASQLLKDCAGYLRLICALGGRDLPEYKEAANAVAYNAMLILKPTVDSVVIKASFIDLQLHNQLELFQRICDCQVVLQQVAKIYLEEQSTQLLADMMEHLALAHKQVDIFDSYP